MSGMMAIQVIPNRWTSKGGVNEKAALDESGRGRSFGSNFIRRPTRGVVLKEDTFATLRVISGKGDGRSLIDAGSRRPDQKSPFKVGEKTATDVYSNFFLQSVQEERVEKQQILETFGEAYIFLFGERARVMSFSGILVNSQDFNWEAEWWDNYENELRGTKCVENDARVFLQFDDTLIGGYILSSSAQKNAQDRNWVNFAFQMFVTSNANLSALGNSNAYPDYAGPGSSQLQYSSPSTLPGMSKDALETMRPNLEKPAILADGQVTSRLSLADAIANDISSGLQEVRNAWRSLDSAINQTELLANGYLNGDVVRIPVGFQGALAFDEDADVSAVKAYWGEQITYTCYQDNDDEYVGTDQYASSQTFGDMSFLRYLGSATHKEPDQLSEAMDKWRAEWAKSGLNVPTFESGALARVLKDTTQRGLILATGIQNWSTYLTTPKESGTGIGPFAAVIAP